MKNFVAIVHYEEGSAFGLTFPDVPGCFAACDDPDGLVAAGAEALGLFFDDADEIPDPRDLGTLGAEVRQAIAEGAVSSVVVPYIGRSGRVERVNISLDASVLAALDWEAAQRKLSRSAFIAVAVASEIEQRPIAAGGLSRFARAKALKFRQGEVAAGGVPAKDASKAYPRRVAKTARRPKHNLDAI